MSAISDEYVRSQKTPSWFPPLQEVIVQAVPFTPHKHPSRYSNHGAKAPYLEAKGLTVEEASFYR